MDDWWASRSTALAGDVDEISTVTESPNAGELKNIGVRTGRETLLARSPWTEVYPEDSGVLLKKARAPGQTSCFSRYSFEERQLVDIGPCVCDAPGGTLSRDGRTLICSASQINSELKYARLK